MRSNIQAVLFDLGGVLIRLRGVKVLLSHLQGRMDEAELFRRWLYSPSVRLFESGGCNLDHFCRNIVGELSLPMNTDEFLQIFRTFLEAPYPGAAEHLPLIAAQVRTGILSNTSDPHWLMAREMLPEIDALPDLFLSYRMGLLKPDSDMFRKVLSELALPAESVLYFDDHPANVEAARSLGIQAVPVLGFHDCLEALAALGIYQN